MRNVAEYRKVCGFLSVQEMLEKFGADNIFLNPDSIFVSQSVNIGASNIFYPNVIIESDSSNIITIGNGNVFFSNTHLVVKNGGELSIGSNNIIGDGVVCIKSNTSSANIQIGDNVRFEGVINIFGSCNLENGCQILGNISVYNCILRGGMSFEDSDVEKRAGLLKGFGNAKGLEVGCGYVIKGNGEFSQNDIEPQLNYHK